MKLVTPVQAIPLKQYQYPSNQVRCGAFIISAVEIVVFIHVVMKQAKQEEREQQ